LTGFSELLWWHRISGSIGCGLARSIRDDAVSPPDLDRLIGSAVRAGNLIESGFVTRWRQEVLAYLLAACRGYKSLDRK